MSVRLLYPLPTCRGLGAYGRVDTKQLKFIETPADRDQGSRLSDTTERRSDKGKNRVSTETPKHRSESAFYLCIRACKPMDRVHAANEVTVT